MNSGLVHVGVVVVRRRNSREWSFARATAERSTAEIIAEGMAPRSSADHARGGDFGCAQAGSGSTNADRGGSLARRRTRSSKRVCPCVLSLRQKSENSGFSPQESSPLLSDAGARARASRAGTPRAHLRVSASLRRRKETNGDRGGVPPRAPMFETRLTLAQAEAGLLREEWRSNRVRRKASRVMQRITRHGGVREVA